jgi:cysteine desulfurase/selenocysteine lyase
MIDPRVILVDDRNLSTYEKTITHHCKDMLEISAHDGEMHVIIVPAAAQVTINEKSMGNIAITLIMGANAIATYNTSATGNADRFAYLENDAQLQWNDVSVSATNTAYLAGKGAGAIFKSIYLGRGQDVSKTNARMIHAASNTSSNMLTKSAMLDRSKGIYRGLIRILSDAKGCDAYQRAEALLLGDDSHVDAEPLLEIANNDVKCSHGVAIGQINEEQLFYMQSRGIPLSEASNLLLQGFFDQVLLQMPESVRVDFKKKMHSFDVRKDFPNLKNTTYLDSGASTQKPAAVIEGMKHFYETSYANVHRGIYGLAEKSTERYELARALVAKFIGAEIEETIFTRGTTDGINMIARCLSQQWKAGDEVLISAMEHHSNLVPWQQLAAQKKCVLKIIDLTPDGELDMDDFQKKLSTKTKIVAVTHVSNVLGTINPIAEIARLAHAKKALVIVDGAQAVGHMPVDMKALDIDFYAFSGHKLYGPDGIGVLYGRKELLAALEPSVWGGEMVKEVTFQLTTWNDLPYKFEPGTPPITQAVGLGIAVSYLQCIGMRRIQQHEQEILLYALERMRQFPGLQIIGDAKKRSGIISFLLDNIHPHDIAHVLNETGIAVRAGHHCAKPLHCIKGLEATTRVSIGVYTSKNDIDALIEGLLRVKKVFS